MTEQEIKILIKAGYTDEQIEAMLEAEKNPKVESFDTGDTSDTLQNTVNRLTAVVDKTYDEVEVVSNKAKANETSIANKVSVTQTSTGITTDDDTEVKYDFATKKLALYKVEYKTHVYIKHRDVPSYSVLSFPTDEIILSEVVQSHQGDNAIDNNNIIALGDGSWGLWSGSNQKGTVTRSVVGDNYSYQPNAFFVWTHLSIYVKTKKYTKLFDLEGAN